MGETRYFFGGYAYKKHMEICEYIKNEPIKDTNLKRNL